MPLLVAGEGSQLLTQKLSRLTRWGVVNADFKTFPDGESYVRLLGPVKGEDVIVLQTTYPPNRFWKLLQLLNAAHENGAASVRCVAPYLAYMRQDRLFEPGESVSARVVADCLRQYAAESITVDLHKDEITRYFAGACRNLSAAGVFAKEFQARKVEVVLAPDAGARPRAEAIAKQIGAEVDHLEKTRISGTTVEVRPKTLAVRGKRTAIMDDIISTGGTMAKATEELVRQGAAAVFCAGVHGLFIGDSAIRLKMAGATEVLVSDTIDTPQSLVSVAKLVADALMVPARSSLTR